jgi:NTE family protein
VNQDVLKDLLKVDPGAPFNMHNLHKNISQVYARGDFSSIGYQLDDTRPGYADLTIYPQEKDGRDFVRFGLGLYSDFKGDSQFNAIASLRRAWLNSLDAEWRTDLQLGRDYSVRTEWYQPASLGSEFFVSPSAYYQTRYQEIYSSAFNRLEYKLKAVGGSVEIGSVFGRWGEVRAGVERSVVTTDSVTVRAVGGQTDQVAGYTLRSTYDQLDDVHFPHQGGSVHIRYFHSAKPLGADNQYEKLEIKGVKAFTRAKTTVLLTAHYADDLGSRLPYYENFSLGGLFNLSAYPTNYFQGGSAFNAGLMGYQRISDLPPVIGKGVYGGVALEGGRMEREPAGLLAMNGTGYSASAYLAADTVVGPFYLLAAAGNHHQSAIYMALGINF